MALDRVCRVCLHGSLPRSGSQGPEYECWMRSRSVHLLPILVIEFPETKNDAPSIFQHEVTPARGVQNNITVPLTSQIYQQADGKPHCQIYLRYRC